MAGSIETKAISALKLELKLELAGAELGKNGYISAPEPKLKKLRALYFLQLSKFEKTKCP